MASVDRNRNGVNGFLVIFVLLVGSLGGRSDIAWGQGMLLTEHDVKHFRPVHLPRPVPAPSAEIRYRIKEIAVQSRIQDQIATTQVSQTFVNTGSRPIEASFVFPLPYDGAIDQLTLMVGTTEYEAKLMTKEQARSIYEGYLRKNQDPALLEWMGTGLFKTNVFPIPAGQERKVTLRYTQVLRKDGGMTDFLFPLSTAKYTSDPIEKLSFQVQIESSSELKNIYSPTHDIQVQRIDRQHASVTYNIQHSVPSTDFRLFFDASSGLVNANLLSHWPAGSDHGYFLLLASPALEENKVPQAGQTASESGGEPKSPPDTSHPSHGQRKTVILTLDRSGSMNGDKMEQAKEALIYVLNNLREGDLFNVIAYDSGVELFRPELQKFGSDTREQAITFVRQMFAGGSTNIHDALTTSLQQIQDRSLPSYLVFLTDGKPTIGIQDEWEIVRQSEKNNRFTTRLIALGVGYDVNSRLIDRLARVNQGRSEFVRPNEDLEVYLSRLYHHISAPVLVDAKISIDVDVPQGSFAENINRLYPAKIQDIFAGQQVTMAGRYRQAGAAKITIEGTVGAEKKSFTFPGTLSPSSSNRSLGFVARIWAARRIGEIIDQLDLQGQNQELIAELVALSTEHGIMTPYTSFLADDQASPNEFANPSLQRDRARGALQELSVTDGLSGFEQRREKRLFLESKMAGPSRVTNQPGASGYGGARGGYGGYGGGGYGGDGYGYGGGGYGGGGRGPQGTPANGNGTRDLSQSGGESIRDVIIQVNSSTIYRRGKLLLVDDARTIDVEKDKAKISKVKRFSPEYFQLIEKNTVEENQLLARQEEGDELLIRLRGTVYWIQ